MAPRNGMDFIKKETNFDKVMRDMNIFDIIHSSEKIPSIEQITNRSPNLKEFLLAEQQARHLTAVKQTIEHLNVVYPSDPLLIYIQNATNQALTANGTVIDRNLLDINVPVPALANSIAIPTQVNITANRVILHITSAAAAAQPYPNPVFVVTPNMQPFSYTQKIEITQKTALLLNRHLSPTPDSSEDEIRNDLTSDLINKAMANFNTSENAKETSTSRSKNVNASAQQFFDEVVTTAVSNSICPDLIKTQQWSNAWKAIVKHFTSTENLSNASELLQKDLEEVKFCDKQIYLKETIKHYEQRKIEAEANCQAVHQYTERYPPTAIPPGGGPAQALPPSAWHISRADFKRDAYNLTDEQMKAKFPNCSLARRSSQKTEEFIKSVCLPPHDRNATIRDNWLNNINNNNRPSDKNIINFMKYIENDMLLREQEDQMNETILL